MDELVIKKMVAQLDDPNEQVRINAAWKWGDLGPDAPLEPLLTALQDPSASVREGAVKSLGKLGDRVPITHLTPLLYDDTPRVVSAALVALSKRGKEAPVEQMLEMLHHSNSITVEYAINALGEKQIIERVPLEPLLEFYASNWRYSEKLLKTLSKAGQRLPATFLIDVLSDNSPSLVSEAAQVLGRREDVFIGEALLSQVSVHYRGLHQRAFEILVAHSVQGHLEYMVQMLADDNFAFSDSARATLETIADAIPLDKLQSVLGNSYYWVRVHALSVLNKRSTPPPLEMLVTALADSHEKVREAAARVAGNWPAEALLEPLITATVDRSAPVRFAAAFALSKAAFLAPARVQEALLAMLSALALSDNDSRYYGYQILERALLSLAPYNLPVTPLSQAMHDLRQYNDPQLARIAAVALGATGKNAPLAQLIQDLHSTDEGLRQLAIAALGQSGQYAPVQELISALNGASSGVREELIRTLCSLYPSVPGRVLLDLVLEEQQPEKRKLDLWLALLCKGEAIPENAFHSFISLKWDTLRPPALEGFLHYFRALEKWSVTPPSEIIAGFALLLVRYDSYFSEHREPLCRELLTRIPFNSLLEILTHKNEAVRRGGLYLLRYYFGNIPLETFLPLLRDSERSIREVTLQCIQTHKLLLPLPEILRLLQDRDWRVRKIAIEMLGALQAETPVEELLRVIQDSNELSQCREAALEVLYQSGCIEHVPLDRLTNLLNDSSGVMESVNALKILADKDSELAINYCITALGDSKSLLSLTAFQILQKIQPMLIPEIIQEATTLLDGGEPGRFFGTIKMRFLARLVGDIGRSTPELIAILDNLLDWPHWDVRMKAVQSLGKLRRNIPDTTIHHLQTVSRDTRSQAVREAADEALTKIHP